MEKIQDKLYQWLTTKAISRVGVGSNYLSADSETIIIDFTDNSNVQFMVDEDGYQRTIFSDDYGDIEWNSPPSGEKESNMGQVTKDTKILRG